MVKGLGLLESRFFVENRVVDVVFDGFNFDFVDTCGIRSALRPFDQPAYLERISLCNGFDGSVCAISDPTGHFELLRTLSH